jgi:hypothetical protein
MVCDSCGLEVEGEDPPADWFHLSFWRTGEHYQLNVCAACRSRVEAADLPWQAWPRPVI